MNEAITTIERLQQVGFGVLMGLVVLGNFFGLFVWGPAYRKLETEKDEWKAMALGLLGPVEASLAKEKRR